MRATRTPNPAAGTVSRGCHAHTDGHLLLSVESSSCLIDSPTSVITVAATIIQIATWNVWVVPNAWATSRARSGLLRRSGAAATGRGELGHLAR